MIVDNYRVQPLVGDYVRCDVAGCRAEHRPAMRQWGIFARQDALAAGWGFERARATELFQDRCPAHRVPDAVPPSEPSADEVFIMRGDGGGA